LMFDVPMHALSFVIISCPNDRVHDDAYISRNSKAAASLVRWSA